MSGAVLLLLLYASWHGEGQRLFESDECPGFIDFHALMYLTRTFLNDLGGNPNKKNGCNETSLHAACQLSQQKSFSAQERRAACVALILQWRGVPLNSGGRERIDLQAQDQVRPDCLQLRQLVVSL
jgi:ankyrin repeat/IBR domain-containing protein 1